MAYQIQLKFKGQSKKITVGKSLQTSELQKLIAQCFSLKQKVIGVTNRAGCFFQLNQFNRIIPSSSKQKFSLVTAKDVNQDSMSFGTYTIISASQYYQRQGKVDIGEQDTINSLQIPHRPQSRCLGNIGDLDLFQELCLADQGIIVVICFIKVQPIDVLFDYYLYSNDNKNSLIVYSGRGKVCEFYVSDWQHPNPEINVFVQGLVGQQETSRKSGEFKKRSKVGDGGVVTQQKNQDEDVPTEQIKQELLQKFFNLHQEGQITELDFYRLKSQLLQNPQEFVRKYQMGTRQKVESREIRSKQQRVRSGNLPKRYEIPIIVRKYNNVVQKISTSHPLTAAHQETAHQESAINLILQLELKGLISQKQASLYKSLVLQEDNETFKLFRDYFQERVDQIQLASRLRKRRGIAIDDSRERVEHNMRILIKYAKQSSYELLRKLALEENRHVLQTLENYRANRNVEHLTLKLQKVAQFYRAKQQLQQVDST